MALKSIKGTTHCWCEEAHYLTKDSIQVLEPTIREPYSEIIYTYNRLMQEDPIYVEHGPNSNPNIVWFNHSTWRDNPFFPEVLNIQRLKCKKDNPNDYPHIWDGEPKSLGGSMYDVDWFEWTEHIPQEKEYDYRFIVADTAYKDKQLTKDEKLTDPDYQVFGYFGVKNNKLYWIDMIRAQLQAVDVEAWCKPFILPKLTYGFRYVWVEPKGHGIYLNQQFPRIKPKSIPVPEEDVLKEMMKRTLDKVERASNSIAMIDKLDKNVIINTGMGEDKIKAIREELIFFPHGVHDDTEDVLCDAIKIALGEEDRVSGLRQLLGKVG
jgi:phage terminase large subunit-like protein